MLLADTMAIFFVVLGFLLAIPALWLVCAGLWPGATAAAADRTAKNLIAPFLIGLPVTFITVIIFGALKNPAGGVGVIGAGAVACLYLLYASAGVAGLATTIGRRLASPADAAQPWRATLRGGIALALTWLLPILGWFVILPAAFIIGAGAMTLSLFRRHPFPAAARTASNSHTATAPPVTAGLP